MLAKVADNKKAYLDLSWALEKADTSLAGRTNDGARQNVKDGCGLTEEHLGYFGAARNALARAAGDIWECHGRNVNVETRLSVY